MDKKMKSGKEVVNDFFAEILNVGKADKKTIDILVSLYGENRLTDTRIENALDAVLNEELKKFDKENG